MNPGTLKKEQATSEAEVVQLISWFQEKHFMFKQEVGSETDKITFDASALADAFLAISD